MKKNTIKRKEYLIAFVITLSILFFLQYSNIAKRWNYVIYDQLQNSDSVTKNNDIAIITIDNYSLEKIGAWPWSRSIHARLLSRLNTYKPRAIAFDILFTEADSRSKSGDREFSQAIYRNKKVVLPILHIQNSTFNHTTTIQYPISVLRTKVAQLAHVDAEIDSDGLIRRSFLKAGLNESYFSTLGLAALEVAKQEKFLNLPGTKDNPNSLPQNGRWVRNNQVMLSPINENKFITYSYFDVLNDDSVLNKLEGKIIFIGVTATGIATYLPIASPVDHKPISSVFYHASIANALLQNNSVITMPPYQIFIIGALLIFPLVIIYSLCKPGVTLVAVFLFISFIIAVCFFFVRRYSYWLPPAEIIAALIISYPLFSWRNLRLMTKQLSKEKEQAEVTLKSIADGVITLDQNENILYMNPVAESLTGISMGYALNQSLESIFNILDQPSGKKVSHQLLTYLQNRNGSFPHERYTLSNKNGEQYTIRATVGRIQSSKYIDHGTVLAFSDITETTNLLDHMSHQATHDSLTKLPNRALLMESLIRSLAIADRKNHQVALLFVDIDKFKNINDGFGHETGDQLLTRIAERLKVSVRDGDIVARLSGDEFVILVDEISDTTNVILITQEILQQLSRPIKLLNQEFLVTCSIGISLFPKDANNAEVLLKNADIAMYSAKEKGRNGFQYFSPSMNEVVQNRLRLEKELRIALENNQLQLFYQPQVNIRTNRIMGVEALLRWNHKELGPISPANFIPLAEDTGLIIPIGEWVLRTACAQIKLWQPLIDDNFSLAVNLSPRQFLGQDVLSMLKEILASENLDARYLKLEITEGLFVAEKTDIDSTLEQFRQMGGSVSIDDFGTGYSSLSYLNRIPVDQVKIDRYFINEITKNARGCSLTKAIISMASDMNLDVIAEGVENKEQLEILENLNCFHIQGFYFSPAIEADKITELLQHEEPFSKIES